jgi:hypothetical protein
LITIAVAEVNVIAAHDCHSCVPSRLALHDMTSFRAS